MNTKRRKTFKKVIAVGDYRKFIFWESLADSKIECKKRVLEKLYPNPEEPPDWSRWEFKDVEIKI